ncbi:hemerythrin domain-containing protein [Noviherbaspirillum pedocola]|uniref:Hemerythrin domain-containing protein n=1 Tax=Noviherbaspirillum pedocola TaxID=2801341 RepID=A0A934W659_9BURK|nr:hemerythrin domain-containing protein [Noviherbaspirillum pedocola]MBK4735807.1 hemerythrin domain-containing protein [Noviherbaspirillum pedocola]
MASIDMQHRKGISTMDNPIGSLTADHDFVRQLFSSYRGTGDMRVKQEAAQRAMMLVEMHTDLEEQVFYPAVRQIDPGLVQHSLEEHREAKSLMSQLKGMQPNDAQFDRIFLQFASAVEEHLNDEEQKLFPEVQGAGLNMKELGAKMQTYEGNKVHEAASH